MGESPEVKISMEEKGIDRVREELGKKPDKVSFDFLGDWACLSLKRESSVEEIKFPLVEKEINKHSYWTSWTEGRSGELIDRTVAKRFALLYKHRGRWKFKYPRVDIHALGKAKNSDTDLRYDRHLPSNVNGVWVKKVTENVMEDSWYVERRFKVHRGFVERVDEAYAFNWKVKKMHNVSGSGKGVEGIEANRLTLDE